MIKKKRPLIETTDEVVIMTTEGPITITLPSSNNPLCVIKQKNFDEMNRLIEEMFMALRFFQSIRDGQKMGPGFRKRATEPLEQYYAWLGEK